MEKQNSKKKFDLSAEMVKIETSDSIPLVITENFSTNTKTKTPKGTQPPEGKVKLTLSVPEDFLPEFKSWCVKHRITMSDAVVQSLTLLKQKHGY